MKCFDKTNIYGQRAGNCIEFCGNGRNGNCQLYPDWQDVINPCLVCKGQFCKNYTGKLIKEELIKLSEEKGVYR